MSELKYQGRDFTELRAEIINKLKESLGDNWTDQSASDPLIIMAEQIAFLQDNLNYYIDQQKRESDIITATRVRNVWNKALRDGYKPHMYKAAEGNIILRYTGEEISSFFENPDDNVVFILKKGSNFKSSISTLSDSTNVVTEYDYMLFPREKRDNDENISQGYISIYPITTDGIINIDDTDEEADETYKDGTPLEFSIPVVQGYFETRISSVSDVNENLFLKINSSYVAEGKTKVWYVSTPDVNASGDEWEEVDDVFSDYRQGKYFSIRPIWNKDFLYTGVQFNFDYLNYMEGAGNGFIKIEYIDTLGSKGTINASEEDDSVSPSTYTGGVDLIDDVQFTENVSGIDLSESFTVYNIEPIIGGMDLEQISSIKTNFKRSIKVVEALITLYDYQEYISQILGLEATALDWSYGDTYQYLSKADTENARVVYVFVSLSPESEEYKKYEELKESLEIGGHKIFSKELRDIYKNSAVYNEIWNSKALYNIKDVIEAKKGRTDKIYFYGPEYIYCDISADIILEKNGESPDAIMQKIIDNIDFTLYSGNEDKKKYYVSKIITAIQNSSERIKSVILNSPAEDVEAADEQFLRYKINKESFSFKVDGSDEVLVSLPVSDI